jgi:hypothetical protein
MVIRRIACICLTLATISSAPVPARAGEVLYNGIELPDDWPPARTLEELRSGTPMEVPYLKSPPAPIPIDVGRQLFVDDFLVESTTLRRVFHKPVQHEANPILRPNKRWEVAFDPHSAMGFSDGVFFDPQDGLFKLWYRYSARGGTAIAFSKDGIHWDKPRLDDGPQPGTNIVLLGGNRDSAAVWLDHDAVDPQARFKLFQFHRDAWQASVHTSPDGIHWSQPTWCGRSGDRSTIFYNPFRKVWVFSIRAGLYRGPWDYKTPPYRIIGRSRLYWESKDFVAGSQWESGRHIHGEQWAQGQPQYWLACDAADDPPQGSAELPAELYNFDAAPYESLMLGLCSVLHSGPRAAGRPKINSVMLAFSRDGYHFDRPYREAVMTVADDPSAWNYGNVQSVAGGGVIVGDRLYMYASGRNAEEDTTGLYIWRRDGFASMNADDEVGTLTTRPLVFRGRHLFVNLAAAAGQVRVELLDLDGRVLATSKPLMGIDETLARVDWADASDLSKWSGQRLRFRFSLRNGALYAFWVTPDESGASHGYVAAGGPGLTGPTDTEGINAYQAVGGSG